MSLLSWIFRRLPASIDVCATTELVDAYVLVIEWGRTTVDVVQHALRAAPNVSESILGAVLNKADIKSLATYDPSPDELLLSEKRTLDRAQTQEPPSSKRGVGSIESAINRD